MFGYVSESLTPFSRALKAEIDARRGDTKRGRPTQEEIAAVIGRTQPYVSSRINGEFPWTTNDIDQIAPLFGETAFTLIAAARDRTKITDISTVRSRVRTPKQTDRAVARDRAKDRGEDQ